MEMKYTNINSTINAKGVLKKVRENRNNYKSQLKLIKRDLNNIMFNIKRNRLSPELIRL
jgi:hypothetical protein